jgi:hypothetical protein
LAAAVAASGKTRQTGSQLPITYSSQRASATPSAICPVVSPTVAPAEGKVV